MQRLCYTVELTITHLSIHSGLPIYKPVHHPRQNAILGGYDAARALHLLVLALLALFAAVHVVQVILHPRTLVDMTLGGQRPEESA